MRELQQHASRLVRAVEQGQAEYRVTVQGRDTGVTLARSGRRAPIGRVTLSQAVASGLWQGGSTSEARHDLLAQVESGRDAMGLVGQ